MSKFLRDLPCCFKSKRSEPLATTRLNVNVISLSSLATTSEV